jgi:putative transposase
MSFWRTYYHLIWATESRQSLITGDRESELYGYIIGKADAIGCIIHAVGGVEDHIHLVASIPPKLSVAEFVKRIKGSSAYHLNHIPSASSLAFSWQHRSKASALSNMPTVNKNTSRHRLLVMLAENWV